MGLKNSLGVRELQPVEIASISQGLLRKTGTPSEQVTLTVAGTDYAVTAQMPAGTKYIVAFCAAACIVAMGEVTDATHGVYIGAGVPTMLAVNVTGVAADDEIHAQSATATAVIRFTYMQDL